MDNKFHTHLNPKLWNWWRDKRSDASFHYELKTEVAAKLKDIADAFIEFIGINKDAIKDIVITGSSASYNYTPQSDIDLHLLVDVEKVHKDCPIVDDFLISKKSEFNDKHDIYIYGIPVEVYAENYKNENIHNGLYSLVTNSWIDEPKKLEPVDNDAAVTAKYKEIVSAAKGIADKDEAIKLIDKIKKMRKAGLAKNGEFSVENLVFKKLRNDGTINKLMQTKKEGIDKELSLEESFTGIYENLIDSIIILLESGVSVGKWATAAASSLPARQERANELRRKADELAASASRDPNAYIRADRKYTKKGELRKKFGRNDIDWDAYHKALDDVRRARKDATEADRRAGHAESVDNLRLNKKSKVSANKLIDAAQNSVDKRFHTNWENKKKNEPGCATESTKREWRARNIDFADPNRERKNKKEQSRKEEIKKSITNNFTSDDISKAVEDIKNSYRNVKGTKQAKTEHENAQILQGLRNNLEKIYNKSEALGNLYESFLDTLEEMMGINTSISGMVDVQPTPLAGQRQPSYKKEKNGSQRKAMLNFRYMKARS